MNSENPNPPTVAVVTPSLSKRAGGLAASIPASVNAVIEHGVNVHVLGLWDADLDLEKLTFEATTVSAVHSCPTPGLRFAPALDQALAKVQADVLHLQGLWLYPSIAALRWRARTGGPVLISPHGMLDRWALRNSAWKKRLALMLFERRNLAGAACIHALAENERTAIRDLGLRVPVAVIPNGVELPLPNFCPSRPAFLAGDRRKVLLFLGRVHPKKGLAETLRAWAQVLLDAPSVKHEWILVIAGWDDGGHVELLRRLAGELGVERYVRFVGPVFGDEKAALLHAADAFILASHSEGLPIAVLEAWSFSCPVFMTKACNLPEGFATGSAVEIPTNPSEIAPILVECLADPSLPRRGLAGKSLVAKRFSWDCVGRDLAAVYLWLSGQAARPACVRIE